MNCLCAYLKNKDNKSHHFAKKVMALYYSYLTNTHSQHS